MNVDNYRDIIHACNRSMWFGNSFVKDNLFFKKLIRNRGKNRGKKK